MKKGYIVLTINKESNKKIKKYLDILQDDIFFYKDVSGVKVGGKENGDFHITLFFGFKNELIDSQKIIDEIDIDILPPLKINKLNYFPLKEYGCKILYLEIENQEILLQIHNKLLKYPHILDSNTNNYQAHITLGFIKEDVCIDNLPIFKEDIKIEEAVYRIK